MLEKPMLILGIETSCDETAMAILQVNPVKSSKAGAKQFDRVKVLSNIVSSQVKLHAPYGGVVPHLAAREHEKNLPLVFKRTVKKARVKMTEIDLIAVTAGPGLAPALWRGVNFANALAKKYSKPLVATNHMRGHAYSNWLPDLKSDNRPSAIDHRLLPILHLIVSGGHTLLVLMTGIEKFKIIGETVDDAAGEAFDKVARLLKLGYPGGPAISIMASRFHTKYKIQNTRYVLPRPMLHSKDFNFSFAGLKTAVLYKTRELTEEDQRLTPRLKTEICHEFQQAVIDVLVTKTLKAAKQYKTKVIALSGGVSANAELRKQLASACQENQLTCLVAPLAYTGDNATMIALAGYQKLQKLKIKNWPRVPVSADANWEITEQKIESRK